MCEVSWIPMVCFGIEDLDVLFGFPFFSLLYISSLLRIAKS